MNPATILTFERYNKTAEKIKKCEPDLSLLQENGRMAVNRMRAVNGSTEHEHIRTCLDGIPASAWSELENVFLVSMLDSTVTSSSGICLH